MRPGRPRLSRLAGSDRTWVAGALLGTALLGGAPGASAQAPPAADPAVEVVICSSHDRVLAHWLRAAREGALPASGVRVLHLDSHPDLAVPELPMPPDRSREAAALGRAVDISSFQLPAVWVGLVSDVVWLRPPHSRQLPVGAWSFRVGTNASGLLRVDDVHDYYVLDGGWAPPATLRDAVTLNLRVVPLAEAPRLAPLFATPTILDVDFDAFATRNPAAERLRRAGLTDADLGRLREIFSPEHLALEAEPEARILQFEALKQSVATLADGAWRRWPASLATLWRAGVGPRDLFDLYRMLRRSQPESLGQLLDDGRALVGLPEHTDATAAEIGAQAAALRDLLRAAPGRPALVTLARSVDDGYTPRALWPEIEWAVLLALGDALGSVQLRYDAGLDPAPQVAPGSPALGPFLPAGS